MPNGTLQIAYKILYELENKTKKDLNIGTLISPEKLGVSEAQWVDTMLNLIDEELIAGVNISENILGETTFDIKNARITLKGAQYLKENSAMKKIAKVASDIITIVK